LKGPTGPHGRKGRRMKGKRGREGAKTGGSRGAWFRLHLEYNGCRLEKHLGGKAGVEKNGGTRRGFHTTGGKGKTLCAGSEEGEKNADGPSFRAMPNTWDRQPDQHDSERGWKGGSGCWTLKKHFPPWGRTSQNLSTGLKQKRGKKRKKGKKDFSSLSNQIKKQKRRRTKQKYRIDGRKKKGKEICEKNKGKKGEERRQPGNSTKRKEKNAPKPGETSLGGNQRKAVQEGGR